MNDPKATDDELAADWPPDAANAELARFARSLRSTLPELPAAAMARVEGAMQEELWQQAGRRRLIVTISAMAASLLVVLTVWGLWRGGTFPTEPTLVQPAVPVVDKYVVATEPVPVQVRPDRPLISLDAYEDLIGDRQVAER